MSDRNLAMEEFVKQLCSSEAVNDRSVIHMPIVTSYGSMVSVSVWQEGGGDTFMVSDDGLSYHEITTALASERIFSGVARNKCDRYGATFNGSSILFIRVEGDRLKGAIVAMASLIKEVIDETLEKSFAAKISMEHEALVRKVATAFPTSFIREGAKIIGQSTTEYEVDALVNIDGKMLAFDYFSRSGNSINSAYTLLSDIARLDDGPRPIGVTSKLREVGPKLTLISSVARVIETGATIQQYHQLAA